MRVCASACACVCKMAWRCVRKLIELTFYLSAMFRIDDRQGSLVESRVDLQTS